MMPFRQAGLSIIEIMVAMVLGALLTLGLVQIFTSNSQSFRFNDATARAQESGRIATDILARSVRNAGYFGCFPLNGFANNLDVSDNGYDPALHEFRESGIFSSSADRPDDATAGTDWFAVSGLRSDGISLKSVGQVNSATFRITEQGTLQPADIIMVSDCNAGDILQISNIQQVSGGVEVNVVANSGTGTPGNDFSGNSPPGCNNPNNCLSSTYPNGAQVLIPYNEVYYISQGASGRQALFVIDSAANNANPMELVDGVEDMQIRFGRGTVQNGVQSWEEDPDAIGNWGNVIATQISLLVRSGPDNLLDAPMTACYPAWTDCTTANNWTAPDRALYRVYTFNTALRNRI